MRAWTFAASVRLSTRTGAETAAAGSSARIGADDFFLSVGVCDDLPYAYQYLRGYRQPRAR